MSWLNPNTAIALIRRRWRSQCGITAPQLVVKPLWTWRWRVAWAAVLLAVLFAVFVCGVLSRDYVDLRAGRLAGSVKQLADASRSESSVQIERSTQEKLTEAIKQLEADNSRLREEVTVLEKVIAGKAAPSVNIARLSVEADSVPGNFQFRLMLTRGVNSGAAMHVRLHWVLTGFRGDKEALLTIPDAGDNQGQQLILERYARTEGMLTAPNDFVIHKIELQVMSGNSVLATKVVDL